MCHKIGEMHGRKEEGRKEGRKEGGRKEGRREGRYNLGFYAQSTRTIVSGPENEQQLSTSSLLFKLSLVSHQSSVKDCFRMLPWFYIQFLNLVSSVTDSGTGRIQQVSQFCRVAHTEDPDQLKRPREAVRPAVTLNCVFCSRIPLVVPNRQQDAKPKNKVMILKQNHLF